jgi:hypothetical protein
MSLKLELQNIISGDGEVKFGNFIQTINNYLRREKKAISGFEKTKFLKAQETKILIDYINRNNLWFARLDITKYIGEGAEQKIYELSMCRTPYAVCRIPPK